MQLTILLVLLCLTIAMIIVWSVCEIINMIKSNNEDDIEHIEMLVSDILRELNNRKKGKK